MLVFAGWGVVALLRGLWAVLVSDESIPFGLRVVWAVGVGVWVLVISLAFSSAAQADGVVAIPTQYQDEAYPGHGWAAYPDHACKFVIATGPTCAELAAGSAGLTDTDCGGFNLEWNASNCASDSDHAVSITSVPTDGTAFWVLSDVVGWVRVQAYAIGAATEGGGGPDVTDIAQYWAWGLGLVVAFFVFGRVCGLFLDGIKHG